MRLTLLLFCILFIGGFQAQSSTNFSKVWLESSESWKLKMLDTIIKKNVRLNETEEVGLIMREFFKNSTTLKMKNGILSFLMNYKLTDYEDNLKMYINSWYSQMRSVARSSKDKFIADVLMMILNYDSNYEGFDSGLLTKIKIVKYIQEENEKVAAFDMGSMRAYVVDYKKEQLAYAFALFYNRAEVERRLANMSGVKGESQIRLKVLHRIFDWRIQYLE